MFQRNVGEKITLNKREQTSFPDRKHLSVFHDRNVHNNSAYKNEHLNHLQNLLVGMSYY